MVFVAVWAARLQDAWRRQRRHAAVPQPEQQGQQQGSRVIGPSGGGRVSRDGVRSAGVYLRVLRDKKEQVLSTVSFMQPSDNNGFMDGFFIWFSGNQDIVLSRLLGSVFTRMPWKPDHTQVLHAHVNTIWFWYLFYFFINSWFSNFLWVTWGIFQYCLCV